MYADFSYGFQMELQKMKHQQGWLQYFRSKSITALKFQRKPPSVRSPHLFYMLKPLQKFG